MEPPPWSRITRPQAWAQRKAPFRSISSIRSQLASATSRKGARLSTPALLTSTSMVPNSRTVCWTMPATAVASETSAL